MAPVKSQCQLLRILKHRKIHFRHGHMSTEKITNFQKEHKINGESDLCLRLQLPTFHIE